MAANNTVDEIRKYLNADSLHYLSQAGMVKATGLAKESFCMACYDGNYPVPYDPVLDKHIIERRKRQAQTLGEAVEKDSEQIKLLQVFRDWLQSSQQIYFLKKLHPESEAIHDQFKNHQFRGDAKSCECPEVLRGDSGFDVHQRGSFRRGVRCEWHDAARAESSGT